MKKIALSFLSVFAMTFLLINTQTSCKKETTNTITDTVNVCTPSINGLWTGMQQNATSGQPFNLAIMPGGSMTYDNVISGTYQFCVGTWTLNNSIFIRFYNLLHL